MAANRDVADILAHPTAPSQPRRQPSQMLTGHLLQERSRKSFCPRYHPGALGSMSPIRRFGHIPYTIFIRNISVGPHAQFLMSIRDPQPNLCSIRKVIDLVANVASGRDQFCSVDSCDGREGYRRSAVVLEARLLSYMDNSRFNASPWP